MAGMRHIAIVTLAFALFAGSARAQTPAPGELGTISFPTSATGAAQAAFLTGVKALHNFEFDRARALSRAAQP